MKSREVYSELGRRERQLMEIVYRRGQATAAEILGELPDPPSYSAVRGMLRLLEDKGYLRHE
ncbi:MAG TPA: BlaI/MecI/CopY family transcriptional regulator, partial [Gemmatimonadaceae bacterium]